jgi:tetratricopeptide (TPR) repeat protein
MPAADELAMLGRAFELQQAGRLAEAEAVYAQVLAANPDDPTTLVNAGAVALARGDFGLAITRFERVVRLAPGNAPARSNLGFALIRAGRDSEALAVLDRAVALNGNFAQAHNNRGIALVRLGRTAEAITAFERALSLDPRNAEAALNLGDQCNNAGDADRAAAAFDRVLAAQPAHLDALTGRAFAQALRGDLAGAIGALENITISQPAHAPAWQTLGAVRNWAWDHAGAKLAFERALRLTPDHADAQFGIASTLLARGDFAAGWPAFERRPDRGGESGTAFARIPVWDGAPFAGTLVVYGEQGFGDVVQFARFVAPARARVDRVVLLLDGYRAPLAPLLASLPGVDEVVTSPAAIRGDGAIARVSILSLPFQLRIGVEDLVSAGRYLSPPADRAAAWRARVAATAAPRVGLAWSVLARDTHGFVTRHKSVPVSVFAPILAAPGTSLFTLQPGSAGDPAAFGADEPPIVDMRAAIDDFADTAALIDTLDLVISADTAVAHVAGALGKPVWLLDRFNSCWRWRLAATASPWYPTMRIFRQHRFGDWNSVMRDLADAFARWHA